MNALLPLYQPLWPVSDRATRPDRQVSRVAHWTPTVRLTANAAHDEPRPATLGSAQAQEPPPQGGWRVVLLAVLMTCWTAHARAADTVLDLPLSALLDDSTEVLDLGYPLSDKSPYWPGADYAPFELKTIATLEKNGVLSKSFSVPEHFGTHVDAPNHFEKNQSSLDEIPVRHFFAPGVVIDVAMQAEMDPDYRLTVKDVEGWEKEHGVIPLGSIVFLNTGWGRFWTNPARFRNRDAAGVMHFPGYSAEAAKFLVTERKAKALGIDTLSIDYGPSKDFIVHHIVNGAGRYGLENVARLDKLPPRNFFAFVAPIKIETGSGGPARIYAVFKAPAKGR